MDKQNFKSSTKYIRPEEAREEEGKYYEISTGKPLGKGSRYPNRTVKV
jgi:hypothetical protein